MQSEAESAPEPLLRFDAVSVDSGGVPILQAVHAAVPVGSSTAIVGPNGAGKTTLLLALLGEVPYRGTIHCLHGRLPKVGYVPQKLFFDRGLPLTVMEFLAVGIQSYPIWLGLSKKAVDRGRRLLALVEAQSLAERKLGALSGGELQRVLLAKALQQDPELLILDEPAAGVDLHGERLFCELLQHLQEERRYTQLMVSHDLGTVSHHADHVIALNQRVVAEGPPETVLTPLHLSELFGIHMGSLTLPFEDAFLSKQRRPSDD